LAVLEVVGGAEGEYVPRWRRPAIGSVVEVDMAEGAAVDRVRDPIRNSRGRSGSPVKVRRRHWWRILLHTL